MARSYAPSSSHDKTIHVHGVHVQICHLRTHHGTSSVGPTSAQGLTSFLTSPRTPLPMSDTAIISSCQVHPGRTISRRLVHSLVDMCAASACSLREFWPRGQYPFHYFVGRGLPKHALTLLREYADILEELPALRWPISAGPPPAADRAYSFSKLVLWNLIKYSRVLYFDPDVFWTGSPKRYLDRYGHAQFAAAEYTGDLVPAQFKSTGLRYINSGIILLRPSTAEYDSLVARWVGRNYTAMVDSAGREKLRGKGNAARSKASEQDLLAAHFNERLTAMDSCENFRGYIKPISTKPARRGGQAHCDPACIIAWHGTRFRGKATCRKPEGHWAYAKSLREWERRRGGRQKHAC